MIYLDNAATTQISPAVLDSMMPYLQEEYGNAGTLYGLGRKAAEAINNAREQVASLVGASPDQIIFTSGGTEANNLAIIGSRTYLNLIGKKNIITSLAEHDSVLRAAENVGEHFHVIYLPVNHDGRISVASLLDEVRSNNEVGLVSVMHTNNELGTCNDVKTIGEVCLRNNILFHTDCVQAIGSANIDVNEIMCDFLSISSHKIHGPKGVGALYVRDKSNLKALIHGGDAQEFRLRGGTENVAGIVGFGKACELMSQNLQNHINVCSSYKRIFYDALHNHLSECGLIDIMKVNGARPEQNGKILSITFIGVDSETLVLMLETKGVCVSAGSACRSHESLPSRTLLATGVSEKNARSTIRVSFSEFNQEDEIRKAAEIMACCIKSLHGSVV